jgi:hypothetical protein
MRWRIDLRVRYRRADLALAALGLMALLAGLLGVMLWNPGHAAALPAQTRSVPPLEYYLTPGEYTGDEVLSACALGFRAAALWEILDTSNLRYNTNLGYTRKDSGYGPPVTGGWVRTGAASGSTGASGSSNCNAWTSASESEVGSYVFLPGSWLADNEDLMGWGVAAAICSSEIRVWCVGRQYLLYLPLLLRYHTG